jgi:hypothetical protein
LAMAVTVRASYAEVYTGRVAIYDLVVHVCTGECAGKGQLLAYGLLNEGLALEGVGVGGWDNIALTEVYGLELRARSLVVIIYS